jgi:hypothetical protein
VNKSKSQREFVIVTLIALISIALIIAVYASLLATFQGGEVVIGSVQGQVWYSATNTTTASAWTATLNVSGLSDPWFTKVNFTSAYEGDVGITWQLERKNGAWVNATGSDATTRTVITTTFALNGTSGQTAYASASGLIGTNQDWGSNNILTEGSYRIVVYIDSKA